MLSELPENWKNTKIDSKFFLCQADAFVYLLIHTFQMPIQGAAHISASKVNSQAFF